MVEIAYTQHYMSRLEVILLAEIYKCLKATRCGPIQLWPDYRPVFHVANRFGWLDYEAGPGDSYSMNTNKVSKEREEFEIKLRAIPLRIPWEVYECSRRLF